MIDKVLQQYEIYNYDAKPYGNGLINRTWKILTKNGDHFILQQINKQVFQHPLDIDYNIRKIKSFLDEEGKSSVMPFPLVTANGTTMVIVEDQYFRLTEFKEKTIVFDTITNSHQAFGAAKKFGQLTSTLNGFNANDLKITIPHFHDLAYRYNQFTEAVSSGDPDRKNQAKKEIDYLNEQYSLVQQFEEILLNPSFSKRVMHHDAKINNILFDANEEAAWVIDPDTIMPGYMISDLGDMFRTYLPSMGENDKRFNELTINKDYFTAIVNGYLSEMHKYLSDQELNFIVYAGKFMIYMQSIRFLADYLINDQYYRIQYPEHNFVRAKNQIALLKLYNSHTQLFNEIVEKVSKDLKQ